MCQQAEIYHLGSRWRSSILVYDGPSLKDLIWNCNIQCQFLDHRSDLVYICVYWDMYFAIFTTLAETKILLFQVWQWLRVVLLFLGATQTESNQNAKSRTSLEVYLGKGTNSLLEIWWLMAQLPPSLSRCCTYKWFQCIGCNLQWFMDSLGGWNGKVVAKTSSRWFKVTILIPNLRSLDLSKGHLTIPKRPGRPVKIS